MPTEIKTVASNDWTLLVDGVTSAVVQLRGSSNAVRIAKAGSKPASNNLAGVLLQGGQLEEIGISGADGSENLYGRAQSLSSVSGNTQGEVTVLY